MSLDVLDIAISVIALMAVLLVLAQRATGTGMTDLLGQSAAESSRSSTAGVGPIRGLTWAVVVLLMTLVAIRGVLA